MMNEYACIPIKVGGEREYTTCWEKKKKTVHHRERDGGGKVERWKPAASKSMIKMTFLNTKLQYTAQQQEQQEQQQK